MSMNSDIFDLSLDNINEGTDECNCDCAATCPGGHIDKDATAAKETSIPVPSKTTLSADTYNAALKALQKSFKEASDVIDIISNATIITEAAVDKNDKKSVKKYLTKLAKALSKLEIISKQDPSKIEDIDKKISKKYNKAYKNSIKAIDFLAELHEKYKDDKDFQKIINICEKKINKLNKKYPNVANISVDDSLFNDLAGDLEGYVRDNPKFDGMRPAFESVDAFIDDMFDDSDE